MNRNRALVLGSRRSGPSWTLGVLAALADHGVDVRTADHGYGSSAGAVAAAQINTDVPLAEVLARQTAPTLPAFRPPADPAAMVEMVTAWRAHARSSKHSCVTKVRPM